MTPATPQSVLLVEDDRVDQMAFSRSLREQGLLYHVEIAGSLEEAKSRIEQGRYDVIISDFYLGDGTAVDILALARKKNIPVIVVTSVGDKDSAAEAIQKGAADFLIKDQNYNYLKVLPMVIAKVLNTGPEIENSIMTAGSEQIQGISEPLAPEGIDEIRFRRFVVDQTELVCRFLPDGTILFVNEVFCHFFKTGRENLIGNRFRFEIPAEESELVKQHFAGLTVDHPMATMEHRVIIEGGETRWFRFTDRAIFDDNRMLMEYQTVAIEITDRKLAEQALQESEERYRMLAENAFDGVMIHDAEGTILFVNQSILTMFGYESDEILGMNSLTMLALESRENALREIKDIIAGKEGKIQTYQALTRSGQRLILESIGTRITYHGQIADIVALRDVTSRELARQKLYQELERKKDFINVASHELRTPLQPVIGYLGMLIDGAGDFRISPEGITILKKVLEYSQVERHMVDQMLEMSLLDSVKGKVHLKDTRVDLRQLVEMVIASSHYHNEAAFDITIPAGTQINANEGYLFEILSQLISNAVNYSKSPRRIGISCDSDDGACRIHVRDNGNGITADKISTIFEPFFIGDGDRLSRTYGRLGLGLTNAKQRAEMLGGTIAAESVIGNGSVFTVTLPSTPPPDTFS
ncbi:MAG: PAS domain S-box protein [Methanoregula sp.]|nr:PAS domain S-box protein [Methanoregula sp.]